MKYAWIDQNRPNFALAKMCAVLDVSTIGYRSWKKGGTLSRKRLTDQQMLALIRAIHVELNGAFDIPQMYREVSGP